MISVALISNEVGLCWRRHHLRQAVRLITFFYSYCICGVAYLVDFFFLDLLGARLTRIDNSKRLCGEYLLLNDFVFAAITSTC